MSVIVMMRNVVNLSVGWSSSAGEFHFNHQNTVRFSTRLPKYPLSTQPKDSTDKSNHPNSPSSLKPTTMDLDGADPAAGHYNDTNRAFLQSFIARGTLTLEEGKKLLAAIFTAQDGQSQQPPC